MLICVPSFTSRAGAIAARIGSLIVLVIMGTLATAHAAQLTLTWSDASSNETGFHIQRKTGTGGTYGTLASVGSGTTGYVDGTVTAGSTYCYRVSAYNSGGNSAYSNEACAAAAAATTYTVSVTKAGTGTGTVASSPSGINCGSTCSASFAGGTSLALSATPAAGSTFTGWSGAYTGTGTCALVVNSTKSVTATFASSTGTTYPLTITKAGTGSGTVTSSPAGISCGSTCSASFSSGTNVTLTAAAASGSTFTGWSGACTGTGTCSASMSVARSVTATFTPTASAGSSSGLVAAYAFNEGSGTTVADASGKGHTGTITGATWTTSGRYGSALTFNGTSARVVVPDAADLDLTAGLTLEAWVYPTTTQSYWRTVLHKETDRYYLMASSDRNTPAGGGTFTAGNQNTYGPTALPANTWSHLAVTYDGSAVRLFVNGTLVASQAQTTPLTTSTSALSIGGNGAYGEYFQGRIDNVRVYNRALSQAAIQADMVTPIGGVY